MATRIGRERRQIVTNVPAVLEWKLGSSVVRDENLCEAFLHGEEKHKQNGSVDLFPHGHTDPGIAGPTFIRAPARSITDLPYGKADPAMLDPYPV